MIDSNTQRQPNGTLCEAQAKSMRAMRTTSEAPQRIMKDERSGQVTGKPNKPTTVAASGEKTTKM